MRRTGASPLPGAYSGNGAGGGIWVEPFSFMVCPGPSPDSQLLTSLILAFSFTPCPQVLPRENLLWDIRGLGDEDTYPDTGLR